MANYADVKAKIDTYIKRNGIKAITGNILNGVLTKMLNELGAGYQYGGMAVPSTDPGTPDYNVVYLAATAGTYEFFDGITLADGEIALLKYNGSWSKETVGSFYTRTDIDTMLENYVRQEPGKGLSTNDYTDEDKAKLDGIEPGAQVNVLEGVSVNGNRLQPDQNKVVDVDVPTDLSELNEDAEHRLVTDDDITNWDAKYAKPAGGIPAEDLAQAVRDLLALADSSLQPSDIVQETGQQTGKVMSQKAVTDAVAAVESEVSQLGQDIDALDDKLFGSSNPNLFDINNLNVLSEGANLSHSVANDELTLVNSGTSNQTIMLGLADMDATKEYAISLVSDNIRSAILYKGSGQNYEVLTNDGNNYSLSFTGGNGFYIGITIGQLRTVVVSNIQLIDNSFVPGDHIQNGLIKDLTEESLSDELKESLVRSEKNILPVLSPSRCVGVPNGVKVTYNSNGSVTIVNTTSSNAGINFLAYAKRGVNYAISFDCQLTKVIKIAVFDFYIQTLLLSPEESSTSGKYTTGTFVNPATSYQDIVAINITLRGNATYNLSYFGLILPNVEPQIPNEGIIRLSKTALARRYDVPCPVLVYQKNGDNVDIFTNGLIDSDTRDGEFSLRFNLDEHFAPSDGEPGSLRVNGCASRVRFLASATLGVERAIIYDDMGQADALVLQVMDTGAPVNPSEEKYILMIGDSLTARRVLPTEFRRYLNNAGLTNWKMVGRVQIEADIPGVNYEAQGGYAWPNYADDPDTLPAGYPNNYFWNPNTDSLDIKYYFDTYCGGVTPSIIVCNVGWNQFVNGAYNTMTMSEMKAKVRTFLNAVHSDFPNCKVLLNGIQRGMPNAAIYQHKMYLEDQVKLAKAYQEICEEIDYAGWVMYGNIAPYFDGRFGIKTGQRSTSMFNNEVETYIVDEVHPNDLGYKMFAYAAFLHFLYMVNQLN